MDSKKIVRHCAVILSALSLATAITYIGTDSQRQIVYAAKANQTQKLSGQYQIDQKFPINEKDDNPDFDTWSLLNNVTRKFYGFRQAGYIWINSNNPKKFNIYINGHQLNISRTKHSKWTKVQIGKYTKDGNNSLQVTSDKYIGSHDSIDVKVPYPILVDKTAKYKNNDSFKTMDKLINAEIKAGYPSAQVVVVHNGQIIKRSAYGRVNSYTQKGKRITNSPRVTNNTLYDLASNTKMWATNMAIQKLVSEKKLNIDAKIKSIFPKFKDKDTDKIKGKTNLTVKDILRHQAGFPADPEYYNNNYNPQNPSVPKKNANPVYTQNRNQILNKIIDTPLQYKPGTKSIYSDVDYMLLGLIIEKVTGEREDAYVENSIYKPLGLTHILYNPLQKGFKKNQIAATELDGNTFNGALIFNNVRRYTLQGEVHDAKAYHNMNGVSGHAGLFSNASDLAVLAQAVINRGGYGNHEIFDENTLDEFIKPKSLTYPTFGLGWRREASGWYSWAFSNLSDASTVGHTGWTGTLTVVNPHDNTAIIVLTNERNTPIIGKGTNFAGGHFLLSKYGDIAGLAYAAIHNDSANSNNAKLISLTRQRYNEIQENKGDRTNADKADLVGIYDAMVSRKGRKTNSINKFLKSYTGKKITAYVKSIRKDTKDLTK